jgi:hypothetical protein
MSSFRTRLLDLLHEAGMTWGDVLKGATIQQLVTRLEKKHDPAPSTRSSAPPKRPSHHSIKKD